MADVTLRSGKIIPVNVEKMTVRQYRDFTNSNGAPEAENVIITQCTGLTVDEFEALSYAESRQLIKAILVAANQPMLDPS
jgi:hypothetical protein